VDDVRLLADEKNNCATHRKSGQRLEGGVEKQDAAFYPSRDTVLARRDNM
jgi:hypothetical protein